MSVLTMSNQINKHVLAEGHTVLKSESSHPTRGLWILGIDVENWAVDTLRKVSAVAR